VGEDAPYRLCDDTRLAAMRDGECIGLHGAFTVLIVEGQRVGGRDDAGGDVALDEVQAQRRYPYAEVGHFQAQHFAQRLQGKFAHGVGAGEGRHRKHAGYRADIDDRTAFLLAHDGQHGLAHAQHPIEISL